MNDEILNSFVGYYGIVKVLAQPEMIVNDEILNSFVGYYGIVKVLAQGPQSKGGKGIFT